MPKTKLDCHDKSHNVQSMMNTRQDNDVTNRTDAVFNKIEDELS